MPTRGATHQSRLIPQQRPRTDVRFVLRALAEPTRLEVFKLLQTQERCVRDLCDRLELPQPLVSHHLAHLARAGLVQPRRSGAYSLYAIDPQGMADARAAVAALLDPESLPGEAHPGGNEQCCR
jgi:ArsR family transcriptional regulator